MTRVHSGVTTRARHKRVLKLTKGQYGRRSTTFRTARQAAYRALQYATRDRYARKRDMRSLWIQRLNAACREHGMRYSELIHAMKRADVEIDRKNLSDLAVLYPNAFKELVQSVRHD